ncbi:PAAR-like domain-containing protein [Idiomarina abyssalis]|uniref:PAAR-like domain-containing protein n=1 Tax=Idiomarina abyssalis TaxID=86102 RepID=UPI003A930394
MANNVFANGLEVACKAAEGKSVAAFPDPCWTPPSPPAGWILVPYANTAYAKDTSNGSKSVFITNKPVMKKDFSFFKTSTGNEPAAGPKGLITGVKKGKAYFVSWSMNVKVEGLNVVRHSDSITHNHGSQPGNTAVWTYIDTASEKKACERDIKRIDRACSKADERSKKPGMRGKSSWKLKNCGILSISPSSCITLAEKDEFATLLKEYDLYEEVLNVSKQAMDDAQSMLAAGLIDAVSEIVPIKKVRKLGYIVEGVDGLKKMAQDMNPAELNRRSRDLAKQIDIIRDEAADIVSSLSDTASTLTDIYQGKNVEENLSKIQSLYAVANSCTRARKCLLQSYNQSANKNPTSKLGCCPGQTGHHLIPKSYFGTTTKVNSEESTGCSSSKPNAKFIPDKSVCPDYNEGKAPVVCVEGQNNKHGSHGGIHTFTDKAAKNLEAARGDFSYTTARDAAVMAHKMQFPLSMCSSSCIRAQLDNYHTKACKGGSQQLMRKRTAADSNSEDGIED